MQKKDNFCINLRDCNLSLLQENPINIDNKLCFNFSKGKRTYIYVREDLCLKDIDPNSFNTPEFKKFRIPKDFESIYNKQYSFKLLPEIININISTKSDDIFEIIKSIINSNIYKQQIIIVISYLKKYIYRINNHIIQLNSNLISNLIYFKYIIVLLYLVVNIYMYNNLILDVEINDIIKDFEKYDDIDLQKTNSNDLFEDIKYLFKLIKNNEHINIIDNICIKLLTNLQLYCKNIENKLNSIDKSKFLKLYTKYIDNKIIFRYIINLKNLIVNVDQSEKSKLITTLKELENNIAIELNLPYTPLIKLEKLIYNHFDKLEKLKKLISYK